MRRVWPMIGLRRLRVHTKGALLFRTSEAILYKQDWENWTSPLEAHSVSAEGVGFLEVSQDLVRKSECRSSAEEDPSLLFLGGMRLNRV